MKKERFDHIVVWLEDKHKGFLFICLEDKSAKVFDEQDDVVDWVNFNKPTKFMLDSVSVHILFKDAEGVVDEILTNETGLFKGFKLHGCNSFKEAILKIAGD